jgi:hypothetical protein
MSDINTFVTTVIQAHNAAVISTIQPTNITTHIPAFITAISSAVG